MEVPSLFAALSVVMVYTSVFKEYLYSILSRNTPLEYFIEGGRSRTGRLLPPKTGMLAMTVHSHLRTCQADCICTNLYWL